MQPHPALISLDLHCARCGYNLRALSLDSLCPECSFSISQSFHERARFAADPAYLRTIRLACALSAAACCILAVPLCLPSSIPYSIFIPSCLFSAAGFLMTTKEPALTDDDARAPSFLRALGHRAFGRLVWAGASLFALLAALAAYFSLGADPLVLTALLISAPLALLSLMQCSLAMAALARRLDDPQLAWLLHAHALAQPIFPLASFLLSRALQTFVPAFFLIVLWFLLTHYLSLRMSTLIATHLDR